MLTGAVELVQIVASLFLWRDLGMRCQYEPAYSNRDLIGHVVIAGPKSCEIQAQVTVWDRKSIENIGFSAVAFEIRGKASWPAGQFHSAAAAEARSSRRSIRVPQLREKRKQR